MWRPRHRSSPADPSSQEPGGCALLAVARFTEVRTSYARACSSGIVNTEIEAIYSCACAREITNVCGNARPYSRLARVDSPWLTVPNITFPGTASVQDLQQYLELSREYCIIKFSEDSYRSVERYLWLIQIYVSEKEFNYFGKAYFQIRGYN